MVSNQVAVPDRADKGSAGGLAVALREAFQVYKGLWFGWSGRVAAQPALQPTIIDTERVQYAVIDLTQLDRQEYYNGFANRALWPTMHYRIGLSDFSRADYIGYRRVNQTFAARRGVKGPEPRQSDRVLSPYSLAGSRSPVNIAGNERAFALDRALRPHRHANGARCR
jgi:hypothetical protein